MKKHTIRLLLSSAGMWAMLAGSPAQAQSWPNNEPAGMTPITLVDCTSKVWPSPWQQVGANWNTSRVAVVSDAGAKYGSAVEKRFFAGDVSGWNSGFQTYPQDIRREIYHRMIFKLSSNWQYHSGGDKFFLHNHSGTSGISFYNRGGTFYVGVHFEGPPLAARQLRLIIPGSPPFTGGSGFGDGPFAKITKNKYHTVEIWKRINSAPGVADGALRVWIDNVEYTRFSLWGGGSQYLDISMNAVAWLLSNGSPASPSTGISASVETPLYWGGQNDTKTVNDWIRVSEVYISGSGGTGGTPPAAPSNLSATAVSSSQINLSWTDNSNNETGFKIERKTGSGGTYSQIATVGANTTSYNNTGLAASTTYYYRVRAYNGSGNSAYSNEANATTQAGGGGGIAFRAASSGGTGSGGGVTSVTLNKPAGVVSGDFMLAAINLGASNTTVTAPAGWTLVRTITDTMVLKIYRKTAGTSEPTSYTWTLTNGRRFAGGIVAFSGVNATTPIQVENGAAHTTASSTSHTTPSITTSGSCTWLVSIFGDKTTGGSTWTPPSGTTERVDVRNTTGTSSDQSLAINTVGPVGAGTKTHTAVASRSSDKAGMAIIALQP